MEDQMQSNSRFGFNKVFNYCLLALILVLPLFFIPSVSVPVYAAKITFIVTLIVVSVSAFLASTLSTGVISLPKSKIFLPIIAFPIVTLVSSFFSGSFTKSAVGVIFEIGTVGSIVILSLVLLISAFAAGRSQVTGFKAIYALLISSILIILHLLLRIFAPYLPSNFSSRVPNFLVGGSIDTAILLGAVVIAAISALHALSLNKKVTYIVYALILFSMLFIGAVSFMPIIITIGIFALIFFVYIFAWSVGQTGDEHRMQKNSLPALTVLALSVIFVLSGNVVSGYLTNNILKINTIEVRPDFGVTMNMVVQSLKQNPLLGIGPNMFAEFWSLKKPQEINNTPFWATEFASGSGFIQTMASTTGVLGFGVLIAFLVLYTVAGFKGIFALGSDSTLRYVSTTSFFVSLFLWVITFFTSPGIVVMALTFAFSGIFIGTLSLQGIIQNVELNIFKNPKANFASVFVIVVLLILSISGGYFVWERAIASTIFQKGSPEKALQLVETDIYWRGFSEKAMAEIGSIINSVSSAQSLNEAQRLAIQRTISNAIEGARRAIAWNEKDYQNWFALGRVYEILAANGIQGGIENAKGAYSEALARSPKNPAIPLAFARVAALESNITAARENISKAIEMKNNYTDAYFTLAQLEVASNNVKGAIQSVEAATFVDPQNATLYFQLGLLKYNQGDWSGASKAFEQAISIFPDYANAKYFLGLSYENLNKTDDAIRQFEDIEKTNPNNEEVKMIITNLKAGRSPFANATPPLDDAPERRTEPPIEE